MRCVNLQGTNGTKQMPNTYLFCPVLHKCLITQEWYIDLPNSLPHLFQ